MKFEVDTPSLASTISRVDSELAKVQGISTKLYAALEAMDGMWVGAAHDTFAAQYQADQQILSEMFKTISQAAEDMEQARKTYVNCEDSVKSKIKSISI